MNCAVKNCRVRIQEWIEMESAYIWTDNLEFLQQLHHPAETGDQKTSLRGLLKSYYRCYLEIGSHYIPKIIMLILVHRGIQQSAQLLVRLEGEFRNTALPHPLLIEPSEVGSQREKLQKEVTYLRKIRTELRM